MNSQSRGAGVSGSRFLFKVYSALILIAALFLSAAFVLAAAARSTSECAVGDCRDAEALVASVVELPPAIQEAKSQDPDVIFHNGDVLTVEGTNWFAEAIAVREDEILAVGGNSEVLALAGPRTELVDLEGLTLMPGFVDPHDHLFNDAYRWGYDLAQAQQKLGLENGITTLGDLFVNESFLDELQAFADTGQLRIRTSAYLTYTDNCGNLQGDWYQAHPPTDEPGEMLRIGGIKIFADGGSCGAPAVSYDHPSYGMGDLWFTQSQMNDMVASLDAEGYQLAIHALGDRAVQQAMDALDALPGGRVAEMRHRIDHNATVRPEQLPRYGEIGVTPLIFTTFPACSSIPPPPENIQSWRWPWRDLVDANPGLPIAWHSDMPWVGPSAPLLHLYSLVTPNEVDFDGETICPTPEWVKQKTLTVPEALPMMTINAAYALNREDEVGSLRAGKLADLIVLSDNPLLSDAEDIKDIDVWMTMVGGKVEYCAAGKEVYCPDVAPEPGMWFDKARNGHGFDLQRLTQAGGQEAWFLTLFSYGDDGAPEWFMGVGEVDGGVFSGELDRFTFDAQDSPPQSPTGAGSATIDFTATAASAACDDGTDRSDAVALATFAWTIDGESGEWCVQPLIASPDPPPPPDFSGHWWAGPADEGWGLTVYQQGPVLFAVLYFYDAEGQPRWLLGEHQSWSNGDSIAMAQFTGFCRTCEPLDSPLPTQDAGMLVLELDTPTQNDRGGNSAIVDVKYIGPEGGTWKRDSVPIFLLSDPAG